MITLIRLCGGRWAALLLLVLLLTVPRTSTAQLRIDASVGFDNHYRPGAWTPLQVRLSGVSADTEAVIRVLVRAQGGTQAYARSVRLRPGVVNGPFTLYYLHPETAPPRDVEIQVQSGGRSLGQKDLSQLATTTPISDGQPAFVCLSQDRSGLNFLAQIDLGFEHGRADRAAARNFGRRGLPQGVSGVTANRVLYPRPEDLPGAPHAYDSVDAVVLGELPLDLISEEQWSALLGWVKTGGLMVISGGADLNRVRAKQLAEILPVEPTSVKQSVSLDGLRYRYGVSAPARAASVIAGTLKSDAQVLSLQGNVPLITQRRLGLGAVVFTAFDLLSPTFRSWQGQASMWSEIVDRGADRGRFTDAVRRSTQPSQFYSRWGNPSASNRTLTDALAGVQSTEAPSFRAIGLFLLCYILVLVPGNYLLLKRADRKELAWLTIPVIIAVFSVGAYAAGYRLKGGQLYLHYCSVVEGAANSDSWDAYSVASIFSPRQARYDLAIDDPSALVTEVTESAGAGRPGPGDLSIQSSQDTMIQDALVNMWDHRQFDFRSFVSMGGPVSASVQLEGPRTLRVQLSNGMRQKLSDCSLSYGSSRVHVGNLAPGETRSVQVTVPEAGSGYVSIIGGSGESPNRVVKEIKDALAMVASSGLAYSGAVSPTTGQPVGGSQTPFVMTGWFDEPVAGITLVNERPVVNGASLLIVHLPTPGATTTAAPPPPVPPAARQDPFASQGFPRGTVSPFGGMPPPPSVVTPSIPPTASVHNDRAYAFARSGDLDRAISEALQALRAAPNNGMVLDTVAEMYQRRGELVKAVGYYKAALSRLPVGQRTETEYKFGETLVQLGRREEGIKHLRVAAADFMDPRGEMARQSLSRMGIPVTGTRSGGQPSGTAKGPLIRLGPGDAIPPLPRTGKGARRYLLPVASGGSYYIVHEWDYTSGAGSSSSTTTFIAPGQPEPR